MENYKTTKEIIEIINNDYINFFNFYDLINNEEICNILSNFNQNSFNKLSHFLLDILNNLNLSQITKNILSLFYNLNTLKYKILPSIKNVSLLDYEILLYSHKFSVICSMSNNRSIYSKIISPNIIYDINNIYIPGGEPNDSLKIQSAEQIQDYFGNGGSEAVYMCSCNYWYTINNCGRPMETFICRVCGQTLGGTNHNLVMRPGHLRIVNGNSSNNGTDKSLNQLINEANYEKNIQFKGFKQVNYEFFVK